MVDLTETDPALLQLALHAAPSGIVVVDERGEIVFANRTIADMFGYRVDELVGQAIEVLLPKALASGHRRHVERYVQQAEQRRMGSGRDLEAAARDGRRFPVEVGLQPTVGARGRMVVATVIDITERKAIETRLLRHEEQLEELVAERTAALVEAQREKERMLEHLIQAEKMTAVGTLVSGIGHEINNPLYVVVAAAEALADESDLEQCRGHGREILRQARHIAETVRNLSRYARPSARHDLQRVDAAAAIDGALQLARRSLRSDAIDIAVSIHGDLTVLAKPDELQQVVFNLARNAIQALGAQGRVAIDAAREGDWVTLRIEDDGPGIAAEHLGRLFDPFFTTKGPDQGEGLGLYIVRQIVTRYGGTITAENAEGGGARFRIRLPSADAPNHPASRP